MKLSSLNQVSILLGEDSCAKARSPLAPRWGSMKASHILVALIMFLIASPAFADWFHKLVRYECDKATNALTVSYIGAYNESGEAMLAIAGKDEWDPWTLLEIQDEDTRTRVTKIKSEERTCPLSDGTYKFVITGVPDNSNILGRCGANVSASVNISNNGKPIYSGGLEGDCHGDAPIITSIEIVPGKPPQVTKVPKDEFYQ